MRTMSGSPCRHYDCSNRNSFGYCKTTVCINEHYQREQWGSPSTTSKSESVVIKQQTNAADVVEVVRCKDCVYWKYAEGTAFCESWNRLVENPDYYCASGRRRYG